MDVMSAYIPIDIAGLICTFVDYFGLGLTGAALPFFVKELGLDDPEGVAGILTSIQFAGLCCGTLSWGAASDRFGCVTALRIVMIFDVIVFTSRGFVDTHALLTALCFLAGFFSPGVPTYAYVFSRRSPENLAKGLAWFTLMVTAGYTFGYVVVGALYPVLKWRGVCILSGSCCILPCLLLIKPAPAYRNPTVAPSVPTPTLNPLTRKSLQRAVCTREYFTYCLTNFVHGYSVQMQPGIIIWMVLGLQQSPSTVGTVALFWPISCALITIVTPRTIKKLGNMRTLLLSVTWQLSMWALCAIPAVLHSVPALAAASTAAFAPLPLASSSNFPRARALSLKHIGGAGDGILVALGVFLNDIGSILSPIIATALMTWSPSMPYVIVSATHVCVIITYTLLGISLCRRPDSK